MRHEPERQPAEYENDRVRDLYAVGERGQRRNGRKQDEYGLYLGQGSPFLYTNRSAMSWVTSASSRSSGSNRCISSLAMSRPSFSISSTSKVTT